MAPRSPHRPSIVLAITAAIAFVCVMILPGNRAAGADRYILKYACFAPEGSTYVKNMRAWDAELRERTDGRLSFRIYPGGVQGDERDMLRKVRVGQLHMVGMTGLGLGEVLPAIRILEMPGYYRSFEEVDIATAAIEGELRSMVRERGFELLGWGEAGTVHVFSKKKVVDQASLGANRMWAWEGDRISEEIFKTFSISPVPLSLPDVLPSLNSGTIDGVYSSPLGMVALQWAPHVSYMTEQSLGRAMGGTVIDKRRFDKLPPEYQALLIETGEKWHRAIVKGAREENAKAIKTLQGLGVTSVPVPADSWTQLEAGFAEVRANLSGVLWPASLLESVEAAVSAYRAGEASKGDVTFNPGQSAPGTSGSSTPLNDDTTPR